MIGLSSKIVIHLGINSYYAALKQQACPNLRGKPVGIIGRKDETDRALIVSASVEAKRRGILGPMRVWEAKLICPEIVTVPADYDRYAFTSRRIFSLLRRFSPSVEIFSIDEAFVALPPQATYQTAILIARKLKKLISQEIGEWITCSIGISYGKTLAKLASELKKPDGLTVITPESFQEIAQKTSIEQLCGIGQKLASRLNQLGVRTISDLQEIKLETLVLIFGRSLGSWLKNIGHGIDLGEVRPRDDLAIERSLGHSCTLPKAITKPEDVKGVLMAICEKLAARLQKRKILARSVCLTLGFDDGTYRRSYFRSKQYEINNGYEIYQRTSEPLGQIKINRRIGFISVGVADLIEQKKVTASFLADHRQKNDLDQAIDRLKTRYGETIIARARVHQIDSRVARLFDKKDEGLSPFSKKSY